MRLAGLSHMLLWVNALCGFVFKPLHGLAGDFDLRWCDQIFGLSLFKFIPIQLK